MSEINNEEVNKRKKYYPLWLWLGEVFWEPFVLAFFIFILFTRIRLIFEVTTNASIFWQMLDKDIRSNMLLYFGFLAVFIIWIFFRAKKVSREFKAREEDRQLHTEMLKVLKGLKGELKTAVKEALREDREEERKDNIKNSGEW